jgi:hypothetical protein
MLAGTPKLLPAAQPHAIDPLFGIHYDAAAVKFEPAPARIARACPELSNERFVRDAYIYARFARGDVEYYVLAGYFRTRSGKPEGSDLAIQADRVGALIMLRGPECKMIGPPADEFASPDVDISRTDLAGLAQDAACRYFRAFGSRNKLIAAAQRQHISLTRPRLVAEAIRSKANRCP